MKRIKLALLTLLISTGLFLVPATASAQTFQANKDSACQAIEATGGSCNEGESGVTNVIKAALNILSFAAGIIAVIMLVIAGLRYITSGGDSNAISGAKNAIIYAIVGLAVVALSQIIVVFVIGRLSQ